MKRITIVLAALLSTTVSANTLVVLPTGKAQLGIGIPCYNGGLSFGLAGLYLKPSTSQLDIPEFFSDNIRPRSAHVDTIDPHYAWGYYINVDYVFPCSGNDVRLSYTHYETDNNNCFGCSDCETIRNMQIDEADGQGNTIACAKANFDYQAIDLDISQHVDVGCHLKMRWFGGLRYANLDNDFSSNLFEGAVPGGISEQAYNHQSSRYHGIGPRIGLETNYHMGYGFGVVGQVASALLVGDVDDHYNDRTKSFNDEIILAGFHSFDYSDQSRIVPNLDGRLGLDYSYQFCNPSRTKFTVEAGYHVTHYFNAIDRLAATQLIVPELRGRQTIDTSFEGPYVGIQVRV
jgi:Legionella pneumophila major outer membrane protein precursor